tara:strand:- start:115 stop:537 length:423 start_codon:yes stop_codon:yes gene_type:complete
MDLTINSKLIIPSKEIQWRFSRSSGAGGQNVNKIDSRVEIIFDIEKSKVLTSLQKLRINAQLKRRIIHGCICIAVQEKRTQYQNRQLALKKLTSILKKGLKSPLKSRIKTRPTKASQRRRIESKKKRGEIKKNRQFKVEE